MQSNRSFCIESLIASRDKFSPKFARDDAELDDEASSDLSDRESPRLPQQSTPFSVNDILNPDKFTRERSPSESPPCSDAKKVVWHPWMSATRYNRPQKIINGKRILIHVYKLPLRGKWSQLNYVLNIADINFAFDLRDSKSSGRPIQRLQFAVVYWRNEILIILPNFTANVLSAAPHLNFDHRLWEMRSGKWF